MERRYPRSFLGLVRVRDCFFISRFSSFPLSYKVNESSIISLFLALQQPVVSSLTHCSMTDYSSEGWETEGDDGEEEEEKEENDDEFEEDDIIDVSDNEILYDKDRNVITEEDIREGLKEIMECHMSKLRKRLDLYAALASIEDNDDGKEEPKE